MYKVFEDYFNDKNIINIDDISFINDYFTNEEINNYILIGKGSYSNVYKIGNKILKLGLAKSNLEIINSKYLIKTYYKNNIRFIKNGFEYVMGAEINDYAFKTSITKEEMYALYCNLRKENIMWGDIKESNVGLVNNNYVVIDLDYVYKGCKENVYKCGILDTEFYNGYNNSVNSIEK